jgi:predicted phage terminase large subunit-like protein
MPRTSQPARVSPTPLRSPPLEIRLPPLTGWQHEIAADASRFKVVVAGRQSGKTVLGACLCVAEAARGGEAWWVAPSFPIGELGWRIVEKLCSQIPGVRFEGRPIWRATLPSGGTVQVHSAENPRSLRGATLNGLVLDEAAFCKPETWAVLRPTLSAHRGWAMFISTPAGLNWFHDLYEQADKLEGWKRWRFPSSVNPHLSQDDIRMARREMSSILFSQEYEAEFIAMGSGVFRADWFKHYYTDFEGEDRLYHMAGRAILESDLRKFHTVDLAFSTAENADYTVIGTWGRTSDGHLLLLDWTRGRFEGPEVVKRIRLAYDKHGGIVGIERSARQLAIIQEANRMGLPVRELRPDKDKVARASLAAARMEQGRIWFPPTSTAWWPDLEEEILAFPSTRHDDQVDVLAYAVLEAAGRGPKIHTYKGK